MSTRSVLGRGLGALIPPGARTLEEIPLTQIAPNPKQPRRDFPEEALSDLAASIRKLGVLQPVVVRRMDQERYELVMGERRWRAANRAGLTSVPAVIIETDDRGSIERALVENIHRQDLNPIEEAAAYRQLLDDAGLTHEQLAERVGMSRPSITNALRLLELPEGIQQLIVQRRLSSAHGKALLGLAGHPLLERIAQKVAAAGLSVRETEELVRREQEHGTAESDKPTAGRPRSTTAAFAEVAERLSDALATRVRVTAGKGRGKITIDFGSPDDLQRLERQITGAGNGG
ncbi:MAG: ParB/RepB/Spo0J family partition protein [Actinomycetota bacterium]